MNFKGEYNFQDRLIYLKFFFNQVRQDRVDFVHGVHGLCGHCPVHLDFAKGIH